MKQHLTQLKKFDRQRKLWLLLSVAVISVIVGTVFDWHEIEKYKLEWSLATIGVILASIWWLWTMQIVRYLINHKIKEHQLLDEMVSNVRSIKQEIINQKD